MNLKNLTDEVLLLETKKLVAQEREILISVLNHLKEIERRRLFSSLGFSSLFTYAVKHLGYSEDQAQRRISAMRLLKELPQLEEKVQNGIVSLTNLSKAQSLFRKEEKINKLGPEQKIEILEKLENKTAREAEKIIVEHSSQPLGLISDRVRVVSKNFVEIKFTANEELLEKIEIVKGLIAHSSPNITMAELVGKLCDLGIQKWDPAQKRRDKNPRKDESVEASASSPCAPHEASLQKHKGIRAQVKREVWRRAQSKCENCNSTYALQIDHKVPRAMNGPDEPENLRLLCRSCNQRAAIQFFGADKRHRYIGVQNRGGNISLPIPVRGKTVEWSLEGKNGKLQSNEKGQIQMTFISAKKVDVEKQLRLFLSSMPERLLVNGPRIYLAQEACKKR